MTSTLILVETFQLPLTAAIKSLYAFGGAGTLVFTLACKDFATEYLNGMLSLASYKFVKGEQILLGSGTQGKVQRLGWFDMDILCTNSNIMRIPYSQISKQTLVNVSRNSKSQIEQTLRFQYKDIDHIEEVIKDIKVEIAASCPKLIHDGSRPFHVLISEFNAQYVNIIVNTHHLVKPCSEEYYVTRHNLLEAVSRAIKKHNISIA